MMAARGVSTDSDNAVGDLIPSQSSVFVGGQAVIVHGDSVESHPPCPVPVEHCSATMIAAGTTVFVNGINVVMEGDLATCGDPATGSGSVFI